MRWGDSYAGAQLQRGLMLLQAAMDELDGAAAWRWQEVQALRTLLTQALPAVDEPALHQALSHALDSAAQANADAAPDALKLSVLDARLAVLRQWLVRLHQWSEQATTPEAAQINAAIWTELRRSTERRRLSISRF